MPGYGSISGKNICDRVYKKKQPGENMFPGCFFFTGYGLVSYRTDRGNAFPYPIHRNKKSG